MEIGVDDFIMKNSRLILIPILIALLVGLSACAPVVSVDTLIMLQAKEAWSIEILVAFFEKDAALNQASIEQTLGQAVEGLAAQGLEASFTRDEERGASGSVVYVININGQGYEPLNRFVLQQPGAFSVVRVANKNQIVISMAPQTSLAQVQTVRYTVQGGEILATNGTAFDQNTVYWINPVGLMEATLQESRGINWLAYGLLAAGMILLGISIFGFIKMPKVRKSVSDLTDTQPVKVPAGGMALCENCQAEIPSQAIFCPNCGQQRVLHR